MAAEPSTASTARRPELVAAAVREVAVKADGDAQAGEGVHHGEDHEVAPVQEVRPRLPAGHAEGDGRQNRDETGDDAVARLVLDRLDLRDGFAPRRS